MLTLSGLVEKIAKPLRALVWSWFSQKILLATYGLQRRAAVFERLRPIGVEGEVVVDAR